MKSRRVACLTGVVLCLAIGGAEQSRPASAQQVTPTRPAATLAGSGERGQYIVEHVAMCAECHSTRDPQGNILPGTRFKGGPMPPAPSWATNWAARAPRNAGLPGYSDEAARRLLMEGAIGRKSEQLRPPMPRFRMNAQDAADVIAYMRSVP